MENHTSTWSIFFNSTNDLVKITGEKTEIGGIQYLLNHLPIYLPYAILTLFGVIVGLSGNSLITGSILISKDLRNNSTCILCLNLALADLSISFFVNMFTLIGILVGKKFFDQNKSLCEFIGSSCLISCATSLLTMGYLAVNRNTIYFSISTWIIAFFINLPNFFSEVGGHIFDEKTLQCVFDRFKAGYSIGFTISCIFIPCIFITFCYVRIFWYSFNIKKKVGTESRTRIRKNTEAIRITKSLFGSFFLFALCWIPIGVIFIIDVEDKLPMTAHAYVNLPAHLNSAINPIFYYIFNPKIREGYAIFLNLITCHKFFKQTELKKTLTTIESLSKK